MSPVGSLWRNDRAWQQRVARDRQLLLDHDRMAAVCAVVEAADTQGALDFVVIYGSIARGEHDDESDLDMFFEASDLRGIEGSCGGLWSTPSPK